MAGVEGAVEDLARAGEADIQGQREVNEANRQAALAESEEMKAGQEAAMLGIDVADTTANVGLQAVQETIQDTRAAFENMPQEVQQAFADQQALLDRGLQEGRTGIEEQKNEALANVMENQSMVMDSAVAGIHGATQQQIADIDAQVQQGTLSPSQAEAMKTTIRMGSSMQLSAAVGQTAHLFTETQAEVATAFGNMFTQFESTAQQVQGAFGAEAAGAFGQAMQASAQFNVELTNLEAQATAQRDTIISQNAATRATFQNLNDTHNMAMLDYTQDTYVMTTPVAINNLLAQQELAGDVIKIEQFEASLELMQQAQGQAEFGGFIDILFEAGKAALNLFG
jgi:hypothetical protein